MGRKRLSLVLHHPPLTTRKPLEQRIPRSSDILLVHATRLPTPTDEPLSPSRDRQSHNASQQLLLPQPVIPCHEPRQPRDRQPNHAVSTCHGAIIHPVPQRRHRLEQSEQLLRLGVGHFFHHYQQQQFSKRRSVELRCDAALAAPISISADKAEQCGEPVLGV